MAPALQWQKTGIEMFIDSLTQQQKAPCCGAAPQAR
jgi:hypothetical protein